MSKFLKKFILIIGFILLAIVFLNNLLFTGTISRDEIVTIKPNSVMPLLAAILVSVAIYVVCYLLNHKQIKSKTKKILFGIFIIIYVIAQVLFIYEKKEIFPQADQESTYKLALAMREGKLEEFVNGGSLYDSTITNSTCIARYKQQITLAFIWQLLFRLFNTNSYYLIEGVNVFGNVLTLISILLICKELSKKYNVNKYLATILVGTFASLICLVTFIYGDLLGLGFAMLSIYFIMKYVSEKKIRYAVISGVLMSIAYMNRMNFLIFILAILIYLFLDLIDKNNYTKNEKNSQKYTIKLENENSESNLENINNEAKLESINIKNNLKTKEEKAIKRKTIIKKLLVILCFIFIVFEPSSIIESYYCKKYNIDEKKTFQRTGYLYMGMSESSLSPRMVFILYCRIYT